MVPIRSRENHLPYKGVTVGDVGNKLGYDSMDNGYLAFDQYRVPKDALLNRFVDIDDEGSFEMKGDMRALYGIMSKTRLHLLLGSSGGLKRQAKIAIRYAYCRRQFSTIKGSTQERRLIDYQTHMAVLGPCMSHCFVIWLAHEHVSQMSE